MTPVARQDGGFVVNVLSQLEGNPREDLAGGDLARQTSGHLIVLLDDDDQRDAAVGGIQPSLGFPQAVIRKAAHLRDLVGSGFHWPA